MFNSPLLAGSSGGNTLLIDSDYGVLNLAAALGNPTVAQDILINITATGIITTFNAVGLPAGSILTIVNLGAILGTGGKGGDGRPGADPEDDQFPPAQIGRNGGAGGDALTLGCNTFLLQTTGYLLGGGGGGGGEGGGRGGDIYIGGSGGGGGVSGGGAGFRGESFSSSSNLPSDGNPASSGPSASPGLAGDIEAGNGGNWGESGANGSTNFGGSPGGNGGAAGKAVELNGYSLSFLSNNEATLRSSNLLIGAIS